MPNDERLQTGKPAKVRLAVLVSGSGTNLQSLIDRSRQGFLNGEVVVVVSDRPGAYGLTRARDAGIHGHVVDYRSFMSGPLPAEPEEEVLDALDRRQRILKETDPSRRRSKLKRLVAAESAMIRILSAYRPDYICLAGFMRLLTPYFLDHWNREGDLRVINIHPALLPAFPGEHAYRDTFQYGCKLGGVTVHFVDEGEDTGPVIAQGAYPIWPYDDLERVERRGLQLEYEMYAQCVNWLAAGVLELEPTSSGRRRVIIRDPDYRRILGRWIEKVFAPHPDTWRRG